MVFNSWYSRNFEIGQWSSIFLKEPRGNGLVERSVEIVKNMLRKCSMANTEPGRKSPRSETIGSPCQLLMSRRTRTAFPISHKALKLQIVTGVPSNLDMLSTKQRNYGNKNAKQSQDFKIADQIIYQTDHRSWKSSKVTKRTENPRSVIITNNDGRSYTRNSSNIRKSKAQIINEESEAVSDPTIMVFDPTTIEKKDTPHDCDTIVHEVENTKSSPKVVKRFGRVSKPVILFNS